jgi:hypothetical protein
MQPETSQLSVIGLTDKVGRVGVSGSIICEMLGYVMEFCGGSSCIQGFVGSVDLTQSIVR